MPCAESSRPLGTSIHASGLRQGRALPKRPTARKKLLLKCQASEDDKSIADKVPAAAQKTIDTLSALLGRDEDEKPQPQSRPVQGKISLEHCCYQHC